MKFELIHLPSGGGKPAGRLAEFSEPPRRPLESAVDNHRLENC